MESLIVNIILLIVPLLHVYSVNGIAEKVILIDKKVSAEKNDEREIITRDIYQWKQLDIEIETPWDNRTTIGIFKDTGCVIKQSLSFEENQNFRYCLKNDPIRVKKEKDTFVGIYFTDKSGKFVQRIKENLRRKRSVTKKTERKEEKNLDRYCRIYLDLCRNNVNKNKTFNYREWFFHPADIYDSNEDEGFTYDKKTIRRINANEYEEIKFDVDESTLDIRITVYGNLSGIGIEIPIDSKWYDTEPTTLSLARTDNDTGGLEIVALNAPPGGWLLKLTGVVGASKYSVIMEKRKLTHRNNNRKSIIELDENYLTRINGDYNDYRIVSNGNYEETQRGFDNIENFDELTQNSQQIILRDESSELLETRSKRNEPKVDVENLHTPLILTKQTDNIRSKSLNDRSSKIIFENEDVHKANINISSTIENIKKQELTNEFARLGDDEKEEKKRIVIDLNQNNNLFVRPGTIHRIIFDVTNNHYQTIRCDFKIRSLPLIVVNVQPISTWIFAGRTINVFVDVEVPRGTSQDVINTLTLYVQGSEITEKSVYLYVEGNIPNIVDDVKPSIEYTFNNNCAGKLSKEKCTKSRWSVDIRIQDSGSGLKNVKSFPNEVYPRTDFISGTKNPVTFYYSATCCSTQAKITATDLRNNYNTYTIDVTAWDNLSEGEIAAITVGALLILLLLILLIVIIILCIRKRKSHDLPYTQRYGSQTPARAERTSF